MSKIEQITMLAGLAARNDLPAETRSAISGLVSELTTPLHTDVWIYRIVVLVLGIIAVSTVIGGLTAAMVGGGTNGFELPESVVAIGSAAVGALAGLLAPSPARN